MNNPEEGGKPRPWGVCLQSGSISAVVREEIKEINRILFVLSEHSLESHDETTHMLFQAADSGAGNHGLVPEWHRDVAIHSRNTVDADREGGVRAQGAPAGDVG